MSKKLMLLLLAALLALCLATAAAESTSVSITDMYGREITLQEPVTRVVALSAADCEILCALGCEEMLVGRGAYCEYPASILQVPVVQSGAETNLEEILALAPQVVLMSDMAQAKEQVDMLENMGIHVVVSDGNSLEEVYEMIAMIGALVGREETAQVLVADMQATFADIAAKAGNTGKTVYFEVSPLQYGLWTAGRNTFMDELASICGLTNIFSDVDGWGAVSEEQVLARDPDYIVTITMYFGEGPTPVEEILERSGWQGVKAVEAGAILNADSNTLSVPGPRLKDAALCLHDFVNAQ